MAQEAGRAQFGDKAFRGGIGIAMVYFAKSVIADEGIKVPCKRPMFLSEEWPIEVLPRGAAGFAGRMCVHVWFQSFESEPVCSPSIH
jgi:hypothetical protein